MAEQTTTQPGVITKEMIEAVAWSASSQPGKPFGMILTDDDIQNILSIGIANFPPRQAHLASPNERLAAAMQSVRDRDIANGYPERTEKELRLAASEILMRQDQPSPGNRTITGETVSGEACDLPAPYSHTTGPDFGTYGSATAMFDVIAERLRQQEKEGWTPEHDDEHKDGELAQAAAVYAHPFEIRLADRRDEYERGTNPWPWYDQADVSGGRGDCPSWGWKPAWLKKTDRRRDLVKAAALIIAEIERLDRAALAATATEDGR
jgi:hypothetical protein